MANEFTGSKEHSAEFFGDGRDFWWKDDFLQLLLRRWKAEDCSRILDVGCGVGHWGRLLARQLPNGGLLSGVDREARWINEASQRFNVPGWNAEYQIAHAEDIPFPDASFDLVTCQTVLIHVKDALAVLREMLRVLQPGGLIVVVEPNNFMAPLTSDLVAVGAGCEQIFGLARLVQAFIKGKNALGEGDETIGEKLPGLFSSLGLKDIAVSLNERANFLAPPYQTAHERAMLDDIENWSNRDFWIRDRAEFQRYYLAGGGIHSEFDSLWNLALWLNKKIAEMIATKEFACSGGTLCYIASARKPLK